MTQSLRKDAKGFYHRDMEMAQKAREKETRD